MDKKVEDKEGEDGGTKVLIFNRLFYFINIYLVFSLGVLHMCNMC